MKPAGRWVKADEVVSRDVGRCYEASSMTPRMSTIRSRNLTADLEFGVEVDEVRR